jgi:2-iminobutanoate/2-iminopropanoate deaminase
MKKVFLLVSALFVCSSAVAEKEFFDPYDGKAPFSAAVRVGDTLYMSGMLGTKDRKLAEGGTGPETAQALENMKARLAEHGLTTADVVKCTVFLADIADFGAMNTEYVKVFTPPRPTRSALAVSGLALNANVEIECIAAF